MTTKVLKHLLTLLCLIALANCKEKSAEPEFPGDDQFVSLSPEFEQALIDLKIDPDLVPDRQVRYEFIKSVDSLSIALNGSHLGLGGLEYFTNLRYFKLTANHKSTSSLNTYYYSFATGLNKDYIPPIDTLDVSRNEKLEFLDCSGRSDGGGYRSSIGYLKLGENSKLGRVISQFTMFSKVELSGVANVQHLDFSGCYNLATLKVCNNSQLATLRSPQVKELYVASPKNVKATWEIGAGAILPCK